VGAQASRALRRWAVGPLHLELRHRVASILLLGAGGLWQPQTDRLGLYAAALVGPVVLRGGRTFGEGNFFLVGFHLSFPSSWVWTR
jgi:hypothetical protein